MPEPTLPITASVSVPLAELTYRATRAGGPGGQHVNTSATRVELWWHPASSGALSEDERARVLAGLARRLDGEGWLRLTSASRRSQLQNKEDVTERFRDVLARALHVPRKRKATRPSCAAKARRLEAKRRRGAIKRERRRVDDE
ncbi:MAG: alternative ribosome rescue aminoacyl-tRNA hydrolase ArfB [Gemmatimonadota bacterium]